MKNIFIYTSLLALVSLEAQALKIRNSGEKAELFLKTTIGGAHEEELVTLKAHEETNFNAVPNLGDLKEELGKDSQGTVQLMIRNELGDQTPKDCGEPFTITKQTNLFLINENTIKFDSNNCSFVEKQGNPRKK